MPRVSRLFPRCCALRRAPIIGLSGLALLLQACGGGGGGGGGSSAAATYPVSGTVSGLPTGTNLVLLDNGGDSTTVSANGSFSFATALASGAAYAVTVGTRPSHAHCSVTNGSGTIGQAAPAGIAVSCSANPVNLFAYNYSISSNASVSAYSVDTTTGALTPVAGSPFSVGNSTAFAVNPAGTLVYSGTTVSAHSIVTYPIDPTSGAIGTTPTNAVVLSAQQVAQSIVFNAAGTMAYAGVVDTTSGFTYYVYSFSVDATTGALTPVGGNPPVVASSTRITLDPLGTVAYVTGDGTSVPITTSTQIFLLDPTTHALATLTGTYSVSNHYINSFAVSPNGAYAYAMDATSDLINGYSIFGQTGVLTSIAGFTPYSMPQQPTEMVFNAAGTLAVATEYNSQLAKFTIAANGDLSAVGAVDTPLPAGANVIHLALDPTGSFVYTANFGTGNINGYAVGSATSGTMTSTPGSPYAAGSAPLQVEVRDARP